MNDRYTTLLTSESSDVNKECPTIEPMSSMALWKEMTSVGAGNHLKTGL